MVHDVLISLVATYLLGCQRVNQQMGTYIPDLCWMDKDTLIAADPLGKQLVKYSIDRVTRTCTGQELDTGYRPHSVSCSQGGLVFVTERTSGLVRVRVYNVSTGHREVWDTNFNSQSSWVLVSLSAEFIILSADNKNYVHNQDRGLLYQVSHWFEHTYVTDTGVFWGATESGLLITNLYTKQTELSTEGIVRALSVSGTSNGYVYVTGFNYVDVGVYSADGTYLHRLHIGQPVGGGLLAVSAAVRLSHTVDLIAFSTYNGTLSYSTPIAVYRTRP